MQAYERFSRGGLSAQSSAAPAHSPPTAKPCSRRVVISSSGAAMPITAVLGIRPTANVEVPMMSKVTIRVRLRPTRSSRWPKNTAPTGRDRTALAKLSSEATAAIVVPRWGKKTVGNTSAAAVP